MIRPATPEDVIALADLKLATFRETFVTGGFAIPYPHADLAAFEAKVYAPEAIAAELADPACMTWVIEEDGRLLGYAKAGPCKLPHEAVRPEHGELYQLYVHSSAQGRRLGEALMQVAMDHFAETRPGLPVWLGVWSGNHKAQRFYARHGFAKAGDYLFPVGAWTDEEYIFRRG